MMMMMPSLKYQVLQWTWKLADQLFANKIVGRVDDDDDVYYYFPVLIVRMMTTMIISFLEHVTMPMDLLVKKYFVQYAVCTMGM
jgi:hypothetical protein